ncbi:MAG TPA: biopolymer transporter ExbD [Candidatus Cloacimonetes bacterium]|nr:biopolymer transporter ExbD [Candidatus Cloacimonadota bacterium]HEX38381.1 biopolymer transporter ExbD [Candidatus Cloacimonadota bacterium]
MKLLRKKRRRVVINITSLIDVVLLLLIFFMISTNFIEQPGMELELPNAESAISSVSAELEVIVQEDETIYLNGEIITLDELDMAFKNMIRDAEQYSLLLRADKKASHGMVVEVMDLARLNGLQKIVIASTKTVKYD